MRALYLAALVPVALLNSAAGAPELGAQPAPPVRAAPVEPLSLSGVCGNRALVADPVVDRVSTLLSAAAHPEDADTLLRELEAQVRRSLASAPSSADVRYRLAAVLGARTDLAEGRGQLRLAEELHQAVRAVLEVDPNHPGAHHILGRLNAAAMRIGGFQRFLARHLFGGELADEASWERARLHLKQAEDGAPCVPDHHYELARLYAERGEPQRSLEEVAHVLALTAHDRSRWRDLRSKAEALAGEL